MNITSVSEKVALVEALDSALHDVLEKTPMSPYLHDATAREIKLTFLAKLHSPSESGRANP